MLFLIFSINSNQYALDCDSIIEIIPKISLQKIGTSSSTSGITGFLNYGKTPLPVVDLSLLLEKKESSSAMHTRIVILKSESFASPYGLICEKATYVIELNREEFILPDMRKDYWPFLGGIYTHKGQVLQMFNVEELIKTIMQKDNVVSS